MKRRYDYTPASYQSPNADDAKLGPAMKALNPRQRAVIHWLLDYGRGHLPGDWPAACTAAGYSAESEASLAVQASRIRHNPLISEALIEEGKRRVGLDLPAYLATIRTIGTDPAHKDALKAALAGAAMSGVSPVTMTRNETHVVHHGSLLDQIREDCAALGLDPDEFIHSRMKDVTPKPKVIEHRPELDISDLL